MDKQSITRDMKQTFDGAGLLTPTQIAKWRGMKWEATKKFLEGLEYTTQGKKKLYFVGDVAERMMQQKQ